VRYSLMRRGAIVFEHVVFLHPGDRDHGAADARQHAPERRGGLVG
jgi:hypothetical protein